MKQRKLEVCQKYTTAKTSREGGIPHSVFPLSSSLPTCGYPGRNVVPGVGYHLTASTGNEVA